MNKNGNRCFLGSDSTGYSDYRIRQVVPLPANMTVMVVDTDCDDNVVMRDFIETSGSYCLVLTENAEGKTDIIPFDLGSNGGLDLRATVVQIRNCPKCGKRMHMTMEEYDESTLYYDCKNCGHQEPSWTEVEKQKGDFEHE